MVTFQQQKQKVLQLFQSALTLAKAQQVPDIQQHLEEAEKHLSAGKLYVVVCGEFKQGKSSLLNAFLNESNLFPVDVDITTNLVSTITYGEQEKISVVLGEGGNEKIEQIQREDIPNYVTEQRNKANVRQARLLIIEAPNPQLKEGLVLVDTPGAGSLSTQHTAITYAFIPTADAILFVSDALSPLSAKELEFIRERILPHCQNLIFVVTKTDAVTDATAVVESDREKLAQVLERPAKDITIIPVSSSLKLEYLKSRDRTDLDESNFPDLENAVWKLIGAQQGQILLLRALSELGRGVAEMKQPIQIEWDAYQQKTQQELDALEREGQDARMHLQKLLEENAEWQTQLNYGIEDIRDATLRLFRKEFGTIRAQADRYLDDTSLLSRPQDIASLIETDIDALMAKLGQDLSEQSATLHGTIETATGLNLNPFETGALTFAKAELNPMDEPISKSGWWEKTLNVSRNALYNATPGTIAGGLLGGAVGCILGFFAGGLGAVPGAQWGAAVGAALGNLGGIATGAKQGLSQIQDKEKSVVKAKVSKIIGKFIEDSQQLCQEALSKMVKSLSRSMKEELTQQIKREKEAKERTLRSLQEARKLSQEEVSQRMKTLQAPLQQLEQLQQQIGQLAEATMEAPQTTGIPEHPTVFTAQVQDVQPTAVVGAVDYGDWAER